VWFLAVILLDVVALAVASLLRSGPASRVLILSVIANPVGAVRTGALLPSREPARSVARRWPCCASGGPPIAAA